MWGRKKSPGPAVAPTRSTGSGKTPGSETLDQYGLELLAKAREAEGREDLRLVR